MNPGKIDNYFRFDIVYPTLLATADGSWHGGGWINPDALMVDEPSPANDAYEAFEQAIEADRGRWLKGEPFGFVRSSQVRWKIIGSLPNGGDAKKEFIAPATPLPDHLTVDGKTYDAMKVRGGELIFPNKSGIDLFGSNDPLGATVYAQTWVSTDVDRKTDFWLGMARFSRGFSAKVSPAGQWNLEGGKIWVMGVNRQSGRTESLDRRVCRAVTGDRRTDSLLSAKKQKTPCTAMYTG